MVRYFPLQLAVALTGITDLEPTLSRLANEALDRMISSNRHGATVAEFAPDSFPSCAGAPGCARIRHVWRRLRRAGSKGVPRTVPHQCDATCIDSSVNATAAPTHPPTQYPKSGTATTYAIPAVA